MILISGRLKAIFWKEFIQMRRDRATLRMLLVVPVMQLLLFGFAISTDVRNLPTAVFDQSHSIQSRWLVQRFQSTCHFPLFLSRYQLMPKVRSSESSFSE